MKPYLLTGMEVQWKKIPPTEDGKDPLPYWEYESDPSEKYRITTPWRYSLSAATVLGNLGMADVDVEIVDYRNSNILPKSDYDLENDDIVSDLKTSVNIKGGAEFRLGPVYLRGGMAYYGNPYNKNSPNFDDDNIKKTLKCTMSYSAGIGFRKRDFYMDVAYVYMKHPKRVNHLYLSYNDDEVWSEHATLQTTSGKVVLTLGFRF